MTLFKNLYTKLNSNKALSLTELIVATVLTGIIMMGMASFEMTFRSLTTKNVSSVRSQTAFAMNMIRNAAAQAVGDPANPGVVWNIQGLNHNICFRYDISDPTSYADDKWQCFTCGSSYHVRPCIRNAPLGLGQNCGGGAEALLEIRAGSTFYTPIVNSQGDVSEIELTLIGTMDANSSCDPDTNPCYNLNTTIYPYGISSY